MSYEPSPDHPLTMACPYFPPEEQEWLQRELVEILNGKLSAGPRVTKFEQEFAAYCNVSHGVAFPNCTASLETALVALGVGAGDEVLVPAQSFIATAMVVYLAGALPVFTEVSGSTFAMDFDDAWSRITDRTKGAIVVHFAGLIAPDFPAFVQRMHETGRFVIEDAAHAHGAELDGRRAGSLADAGCFSFYPTKVMTMGEGGMLVSSREEVALTARSLQNRGLDLESAEETYVLPGRNNRVTEIAASMGLSQLRCLPDFLTQRRNVARIYDTVLAESELFRPLKPGPGSVPSYWRYVVMPTVGLDRVALKHALSAEGISIDWAYAPPMHLQPVFQQLMGTRPGMLPRTETLSSRHICLPIHARMRGVDAEYVARRVVSLGSQLAGDVI